MNDGRSPQIVRGITAMNEFLSNNAKLLEKIPELKVTVDVIEIAFNYYRCPFVHGRIAGQMLRFSNYNGVFELGTLGVAFEVTPAQLISVLESIVENGVIPPGELGTRPYAPEEAFKIEQ